MSELVESKSKSRSFENFHTYIKKLSLKIKKKSNITLEAKDILNSFIIEFTKNIIFKSCYMAREYGKCKIDINNTSTIFSILYPEFKLGNVLKHIETFSEKVPSDRFEPRLESSIKKPVRKNKKAGLIFHPNRFKNLFEKYKYSGIQIYETAIIFLTALLEEIVEDIISKAFEIMGNKITLTGEYIYKTRHPLLKNYGIIGYGVI